MEQEINRETQVEETKTPMGVIVSIVIIVGILVVGAFYSLKQLPPVQEETNEFLAPEKAEIDNDTIASKLSTQGTSTAITDIKKDLDATDLSEITAGLKDITF